MRDDAQSAMGKIYAQLNSRIIASDRVELKERRQSGQTTVPNSFCIVCSCSSDARLSTGKENVMATQDLGDGLRKVLLAGVGALATGIEKSQAIVDDLARKGEITVEQGKQLNSELKRTFRENTGAGARSAAAERVDAQKVSEETPSEPADEGSTGDPDDLGNNVDAL